MRWRCASAPTTSPFTEPSAEMDVRYERVGDAVKVGSGDKMAGNPRLRHGPP